MRTIRTLAALAIAAVVVTMITGSALAADTHRVRARLDGDTLASGKADYRERIRNNGDFEQRFSIQVEDAEANVMLMVQVNDLVVGIIVTDDFGFGELQYRTAAFIDEPGDGEPIPDGFPTLHDGDTVTVGPLAGVLE